MDRGQIILDDAFEILGEYLMQKPHGMPRGPGDAFLVWVNDNQGNPERCRIVTITALPGDPRRFVEFPDDLNLAKFDSSDRKFVAAVRATGDAGIVLNATDTDWWHFREALATHGVHVEFLCPELMND
jgi:hypothetical protein